MLGVTHADPGCTVAAWPTMDYEEGSFLTQRGRLSLPTVEAAAAQAALTFFLFLRPLQLQL